MSSTTRRMFYIMLTALMLRAVFALVLPDDKFIFSDARHYDYAARNLLAGEGLGEKYHRPPLYPLFMAAIYGIFGKSFLAVRLFEAAMGALLCLLVFAVGRRLFGETTALIAAALSAVHPHFILIAGILYPTHLYTVLLALTLWFVLKYDEKRKVINLAAGAISASLAALAVPALFFILPFLFLWLLLRPVPPASRTAAAGLFLLVFVLVLLPWTLRNYRLYGRLTLVQPVPHTVFPKLDDLQAQKEKIDAGFPEVTEYLKKHPRGTKEDRLDRIIVLYLKHPLQTVRYVIGELGHFWALYPDRLDTASADYQRHIASRDGRFFALKSHLWAAVRYVSIVVMAPLFLFALFGIYANLPLKREKWLILAVVLGQSLGYSLIYAEVRYRIPIEPYVLMFTAAGSVWLKQQADKRQTAEKAPADKNYKHPD